MHGGASTGPRTAEGMERIRTARTTTGLHTAEMREMRAAVHALMAGAKKVRELVACTEPAERAPKG